LAEHNRARDDVAEPPSIDPSSIAQLGKRDFLDEFQRLARLFHP